MIMLLTSIWNFIIQSYKNERFFSFLVNIKEVFSLPGIIIHEIAHRITAEYYGKRIIDINYLKFMYTTEKSTMGSVEYRSPESPFEYFMINISPFFFNNIIAIILFMSILSVFSSPSGLSLVIYILLLYITLTIFAKSIISYTDYQNIKKSYNEKQIPVGLYVILTLIKYISLSNKYFIDYVYAIGIMILLYHSI